MYIHVCMFAVHNIWICVHAALLCVGEGHRHARDEEHRQEGDREAAGGDPDLVPRDRVPLLRPDQFDRRIAACELHCVHNSVPGAHDNLCSRFC